MDQLDEAERFDKLQIERIRREDPESESFFRAKQRTLQRVDLKLFILTLWVGENKENHEQTFYVLINHV